MEGGGWRGRGVNRGGNGRAREGMARDVQKEKRESGEKEDSLALM